LDLSLYRMIYGHKKWLGHLGSPSSQYLSRNLVVCCLILRLIKHHDHGLFINSNSNQTAHVLQAGQSIKLDSTSIINTCHHLKLDPRSYLNE